MHVLASSSQVKTPPLLRGRTEVELSGIARVDKVTKHLVKRLKAHEIAVINHKDIDRLSGEALATSGIKAVINANTSISGAYPNSGPKIVVSAGIYLLDNVGEEVMTAIKDGETISIVDDTVYSDGKPIATGEHLTIEDIETKMRDAEGSLYVQLGKFAENTIHYIEEEKGILVEDVHVPKVKVRIEGRPVLVVVRGYDYKEDLRTLMPYIKEMRPVLIGVDGGADAIIDAGLKPDIIIGDMDSVSDTTLLSGAEVVPHAYADGRCPAKERLDKLGIKCEPWPLAATSEDLALLLSYESGADLIIALGTHTNLVEYMDKGRKGMASSFLVRLRVGPKLIDAKGVNKIYRASASPRHVVLLVLAFVVVTCVIFAISEPMRTTISLLWFKISLLFG